MFGSGAAPAAPAFPIASSAAPASGTPAVAAVGGEAAETTVGVVQPEDEEAELLALGLQPSAKAKCKAKAKAKRSRGEVVEEDVARLTAELNTVIAALNQFPAGPRAQDFGRVDRMLSKKKSELKDSFEFESANEIQRLQELLELVRAAWKPAHAYMTGTIQTRKKNVAEFSSKMGQLHQQRPDIFKKFPAETVAAWLECDVAARVEKMEWAYLANLMSKEELEKVGADPIPTFEKVVAFYIRKMEAIIGCF